MVRKYKEDELMLESLKGLKLKAQIKHLDSIIDRGFFRDVKKARKHLKTLKKMNEITFYYVIKKNDETQLKPISKFRFNLVKFLKFGCEKYIYPFYNVSWNAGREQYGLFGREYLKTTHEQEE